MPPEIPVHRNEKKPHITLPKLPTLNKTNSETKAPPPPS